MNRILIINKPIGISSMSVIKKLRPILKIKKMGHAGTLDPLATGVLIVCTEKATKLISSFMDLPKEYIAEINLTAFSDTDDAEGPFSLISINLIPTKEMVLTSLAFFLGAIEQTPPRFSAIKMNGVPAYKKARNGMIFDIKPRTITIYELELLEYTWPLITIRVACSKGTYIRSLARDIGLRLGTGGYISALCRTKIGEYDIKDSLTIEAIQQKIEADTPENI